MHVKQDAIRQQQFPRGPANLTEHLRARGWLEAASGSVHATEGLLVAFIVLCGMGSGL